MSTPSSDSDVPVFRAGAGRVSLDFVRTLRHRGTSRAEEELVDGYALAAWLKQCGPCPVGRIPPDAQVIRARELRESVFVLIEAARIESLERCPPHIRGLVNEIAVGAPPAPRLDAAGRLGWTAADPVAATLALIARDALELAGSELGHRIRICEGHDCRALFLDMSRPGTRRWCSMGTCGNRAKKQALRERARR